MRTELELLQHEFALALIDINQVDSALDSLKGPPEITRERFALYRGNIVAIWQQSCAAAYPVLKRLLGDAFFNDVARNYGSTYPSQSGNLTEFGASLPHFISTLKQCDTYPYLSDVAKLEWLIHRSYYAGLNAPVTIAQLAAIPTDQLSDVRFEFQPGCFLFESPWSAANIWRAHQKNEVIFPEQFDLKTVCLIRREPWQSSWNVQLDELSTASYLALKALQEGATLGAALELAITAEPAFEVQNELSHWLNNQLFSSIKPRSTPG